MGFDPTAPAQCTIYRWTNLLRMRACVLWILQTAGARIDIDRLHAVLFLADARHISEYCIPLYGEIWIREQHSVAVRGAHLNATLNLSRRADTERSFEEISVDRHMMVGLEWPSAHVAARRTAQLDRLWSQSNRTAITAVWEEVGHIPLSELDARVQAHPLYATGGQGSLIDPLAWLRIHPLGKYTDHDAAVDELLTQSIYGLL